MPDTLPNWFFTLPTATPNSIYSFGVSDPDMAPHDAYMQAFHRAKFFAVLMHNCKIQYFRDVFTTVQEPNTRDEYRQRFDTYLKFSSSEHIDTSAFKVVNYHFTRFNEAVVQVSYNPSLKNNLSSESLSLSTQATVLYVEAQFGDIFEPQAEYEFNAEFQYPNGQSQNSIFTFVQKGERESVASEFNGILVDYPVYTYRYADPRWTENTTPLVTYNGLWSIYAKEFLRQVSFSAEQSTVRIRSLGQSYNPENSNLSREIAILNTNIDLNGIVFGRDSIVFSFQLNQVYP